MLETPKEGQVRAGTQSPFLPRCLSGELAEKTLPGSEDALESWCRSYTLSLPWEPSDLASISGSSLCLPGLSLTLLVGQWKEQELPAERPELNLSSLPLTTGRTLGS